MTVVLELFLLIPNKIGRNSILERNIYLLLYLWIYIKVCPRLFRVILC